MKGHVGKLYTCKYCERASKTRGGCNKRRFSFYCDIWGKGFNYKSDFNDHRNSHSKPFWCMACLKSTGKCIICQGIWQHVVKSQDRFHVCCVASSLRLNDIQLNTPKHIIIPKISVCHLQNFYKHVSSFHKHVKRPGHTQSVSNFFTP